MKLKSTNNFFKNILAGLAPAFRKHYGAFFFILFLLSVLLWGWVFWQYGYNVVFGEPNVEIRMISVKKAGLEKIMQDLENREKAALEARGKSAFNPFIERMEEIPVLENSTFTSATSSEITIQPAN